MLVRLPHAPWSFGESVVMQDTLRLEPHDGKQTGSIALDALQSGTELTCEKTNKG